MRVFSSSIAIFLLVVFFGACSPNTKGSYSSFMYRPKNRAALTQDMRGTPLVRVKLYAGEATTVFAENFSFTTGKTTRRGSKSITITEAGIIEPQDTFTFKGKRYHGSLEVRPSKGRWLYVNHVPMDEYLTSVVSHEMSPSWNKEALKAQAVVARTYLLQKIKERAAEPYDVDTSTNYQVYGGVKKGDQTSRIAVSETHDEVLYYGANLAQTFFHSSCGGTLASSEEVWGKSLPYLTAKNSAWCSAAPVYKWQIKISLNEISRHLKIKNIKALRVIERSKSKRVKTIQVTTSHGAKKVRADKFRIALGALKVKSTFFGVAKAGNSVILTGRGFGHGVGMCQWGAKLEADAHGTNYRRILEHYFPGTSLRTLNSQRV